VKTSVILLALAACVDEHELGNNYTLRQARWAVNVDHQVSLVAIAPGGDVVAAGGNSPYPGIITRHSGSDGHELWRLNYSATGNLEVSGLAVDDAGNSYVAGSYSVGVLEGGVDLPLPGNAYVIAITPDGHVLWANVLDTHGGSRHVLGFAVAPDGTSYLSGSFQDEIDFPNATLQPDPTAPCILAGNCYLASFDSAGHVRWGQGVPLAGQLGIAGDGAVLVGVVPRSTTFGGVRIDLQTASDRIAAGITSDGQVAWVQPIGLAGLPYSTGNVAVANDGRIATTTGYSTSVTPNGLTETLLDPTGHALWSASMTSGAVRENGIAATNDTVLTAGQMLDWSVDFGNGPKIGLVYVAARDTSGNFLDAETFGTPGDAIPPSAIWGVAASGDGVAFVADTGSPMTIGTQQVDAGHVIALLPP
jgi:hypothetical protein